MARVNFVKKARKAIPESGIAVGDSYYWWKFPYGSKHVSKDRPRDSQLTQGHWSGVYAARESIEDCDDFETIGDVLSQAAEDVRAVAEEYRESVSNMESAFPNGSPTIESCNEKADHLDSLADEIESAASGVDDEVTVDESDVPELLKNVDVDPETDAESVRAAHPDLDCTDVELATALETYRTALDEAKSAKLEEVKEEAEGLDWESPC